MNFHVGTFRLHIHFLAKFEFSAQTTDESRFNFLNHTCMTERDLQPVLWGFGIGALSLSVFAFGIIM